MVQTKVTNYRLDYPQPNTVDTLALMHNPSGYYWGVLPNGEIVSRDMIEVAEQSYGSFIIPLQDYHQFYKSTQTYTGTSGNISVTIDSSQLGDTTGKVLNFEWLLDTTTINVPFSNFANITWVDGGAPNITNNTIYLFSFMSVDGGAKWYGNTQFQIAK